MPETSSSVYRIRIGRQIGSAALIADGLHARTDGLTSLAVLVGALGVAAGFPLAAPLPTERTLRQRKSLLAQFLRFALINLPMIRMVRKGHH